MGQSGGQCDAGVFAEHLGDAGHGDAALSAEILAHDD